MAKVEFQGTHVLRKDVDDPYLRFCELSMSERPVVHNRTSFGLPPFRHALSEIPNPSYWFDIGRNMLKALRALHRVLMSKTLAMHQGSRCTRIVQDQHGFTLTELAIGIAIISILAAVAIPNIQQLMMQYRLKGASRQVIGDLMAARMKAVSQHRKFKVFFTDSQEYRICDDANGDGSVDDCEGSAHIVNLQANYSGVSASSVGDPIFGPTGTASENTTITLTNLDGMKSISVYITGQVKIN